MWRKRLREAVRKSGVTQAEIARRAGVSAETVSRVLSGAHARPEFSTVIRIARAARVRVGWLLDEPEPRRGVEFTDRERATIMAAGVILIEAMRR